VLADESRRIRFRGGTDQVVIQGHQVPAESVGDLCDQRGLTDLPCTLDYYDARVGQ
jgi:hypothetical protein